MAVHGIFHTSPALVGVGLADLNITETNIALAERHFKTGHEYFKREDYAAALIEFQRSYELSQKPKLLHNIGMCHYFLGAYAKAIEFFARYLREDPTAEQRTITEQFIQLAKQQLPQKPRKPDSIKTPPPAPPPPPIQEELALDDEAETQPTSPYRLRMWISFGLFGVATASLATSGVTYFIAKDSQDQHEQRVRELMEQGRIVGQPGQLRFADRKAKARHEGELEEIDGKMGLYQDIAKGTLIGGVILTGAALTFYLLEKRSIKVNPQVGEKTGFQLEVEF